MRSDVELSSLERTDTVLSAAGSAAGSTARVGQSSAGLGQLPPADRGRAAYQILAATLVIELAIWALPSSYGVLLEHYLSTEPLRSQPGAAGQLALVGTLQTGALISTEGSC